MRIIGFSIKKVSAERINPIKEKIQISSNIDIKDIQKEEIGISDKPGLKFDFGFNINYEPKVANIEISGSIMVLDDKDESKIILKDWKKKRFIHSIKVPLYNFIMDKCNLKALQLEEELGLPMHIPLPKVRQGKPQPNNGPANYAG